MSVRNTPQRSTCCWLEPEASKQEVKTRFKELVKRHQPEANGGDRSSEGKLREIIQAYKYLRSIGFG